MSAWNSEPRFVPLNVPHITLACDEVLKATDPTVQGHKMPSPDTALCRQANAQEYSTATSTAGACADAHRPVTTGSRFIRPELRREQILKGDRRKASGIRAFHLAMTCIEAAQRDRTPIGARQGTRNSRKRCWRRFAGPSPRTPQLTFGTFHAPRAAPSRFNESSVHMNDVDERRASAQPSEPL